jgi:hypothetical protein
MDKLLRPDALRWAVSWWQRGCAIEIFAVCGTILYRCKSESLIIVRPDGRGYFPRSTTFFEGRNQPGGARELHDHRDFSHCGRPVQKIRVITIVLDLLILPKILAVYVLFGEGFRAKGDEAKQIYM